MKYAENPSQIPSEGPHSAILLFSTVHIPGDERSRTNPGHGYPAEDRPICQYIVFVDTEEMQQWIQRHDNASFVVLKAQRRTVTKKYEISL